MEKFSQYRDKGSGIAPFLPIPAESAGVYLPLYTFLFAIRIPFLIAFSLSYFFFLQWLPIGAIGKKASLWCILGVPGLWWIDLQIDGVRKGTVNSHTDRFPQPGSIIAASLTSPIDPLYLAVIFDPIFTASWPGTKLVRRISLLEAIFRAFAHPQMAPQGSSSKLVELETLTTQNPKRYVVVFPECTTSNGRGILPLSPSLLSASSKTKVFPVSLRYTAPDITNPIPHTYFQFLWNLCSRPTHCIRTRIAGSVNVPTEKSSIARTTAADVLDDSSNAETLVEPDEPEANTNREEKAFLDRVAEDLARLGRVKRVSLGVKDKLHFVAMWTGTKRK